VYALPGRADAPGARPGGIPGRRLAPAEAHQRPPGPAPDVMWTEAAGSAQSAARLARVSAELLTSAEASANLVVLRTPAGAAQYLASVLDHANWTSILGTIAGDDTVLIVTRDPAGGTEVADGLLRLAERRP
jgi:transcriptional regulator of arginine metabolism